LKGRQKNRLFLSILAILMLTAIMGACSHNKESNAEGKHRAKVYMEGSFSINMDDPRATVGDADYVFLARVDKKGKTVYKNKVQIETENGTKEIATPYTNYKVTVLKNIKGSLQTDQSIPVQKAGGIDKKGESIVTFEDDALPEVGKTYVFLAYVQDDGSLLISGPHSNTLVANIDRTVTSQTVDAYAKQSDVVSYYEKAYDHQIITDRKRSISKYDTSAINQVAY
jgi:hypothetical protein